MKKKEISTYYFIGRLSPAEFCTNFNPGEIHLGNGLVLDIFQDGISIWIPGTRENFDAIRSMVVEAFDITITTFMFITNLKLNFNLQSWVEAKGIVSKKNIIGFIIPPGARRINPNRRSKYSALWRRAGRFYLKIKESFHHKIALSDYKNLINTYGDDAFFFAYRIVEDIRRTVTHHLGDGLEKEKYWREMHNILGTNKSQIDPLVKVAEKVRHGEVDAQVVIEARERRDQIIKIALEIMKSEFKRSFRGLI
jgi:hypothetical protein